MRNPALAFNSFLESFCIRRSLCVFFHSVDLQMLHVLMFFCLLKWWMRVLLFCSRIVFFICFRLSFLFASIFYSFEPARCAAVARTTKKSGLSSDFSWQNVCSRSSSFFDTSLQCVRAACCWISFCRGFAYNQICWKVKVKRMKFDKLCGISHITLVHSDGREKKNYICGWVLALHFIWRHI